METNSLNKDDGLYRQLLEQYGKIVYSQQSQINESCILKQRFERYQKARLFCLAVTSGGALGTVFSNNKIWALFTAVLSAISLYIDSYLKGSDYPSRISSHKIAADKLWVIRERYISLLTDYSELDHSQVIDLRNELIEKSAEIYEQSPSTSSDAYHMAQINLKDNENQYFSDDELNRMLPKHLRIE